MRYISAFMVLAIITSLASCDRSPTAHSDVPQHGVHLTNEADRFDFSHKGADAPSVRFTSIDGKPLTLAQFRGRPVLVNLWATWCIPCIKELLQFDVLASKYQGKIAVIAVSEDAGGRTTVAPFWKSRGFETLPTYLDPKSGLSVSANLGGLPATTLYDGNGKEVWRASGAADWTGSLAARMIALSHG